ncbi:uncharacterized protein L969DRAFT_93764 [Mixia osmundae IAM 14324]|uniref:Anaphase-promoting complex subunit 4 WD40 domain-containing protein n=1 Tax=Mixia osmundae (strain CBS 9802 / IAM 14324 / JCM 22182 / KY 12970) TaxID=764103 RepID=G7E9I2_MIXOS|nr:uncharacterized protein L969DRAFT_93764 [Mixia osmundae IAM 14324]KEI39933.1 hypothetical protein L969DRAFT_93764 [Mixia osmundae IAM 14324]GAA99301.1 hypothetical protein E5Q_05996 [Mixia osmundae IAM 14324]
MSQDIELTMPADAIAALAFHPTDKDLLATAEWDSTVKLYNTSLASSESLQSTFAHRAPVLDVSFDGTGKIYSGGLDKAVRQIDPSTSSQTILGNHSAGVKCVRWSDKLNALVTASWDSTLRVWDPRQATGSATLICNLPSKAFSLDLDSRHAIVATAHRHVIIYDLASLAKGVVEPLQTRESSLKYMTRAVRLSPAGTGYATTSIEGRIAVDFLEGADNKPYAFKAHRAVIDDIDTVFPVNALTFHPIHGTFATGGGDSLVNIWDLAAKKRLRQFQRYPASISALAFNVDGSKLAIACSKIEEEGVTYGAEAKNALFVKTLGQDDCKPKSAK